MRVAEPYFDNLWYTLFMENNTSNNIDINQKIVLLEKKIDYLVSEAEKAARARKITIIVTLIFVVAPIIIAIIAIPTMISTVSSMYQL